MARNLLTVACPRFPIGNDCLDDFCCFWRVIERIATSYADNSDWDKEDGVVLKSIAQLTADLFLLSENAPDLLRDKTRVKRARDLRNDNSHGNVPISLDMIDLASEELEALEEAAFAVLDQMRRTKLDMAI